MGVCRRPGELRIDKKCKFYKFSNQHISIDYLPQHKIEVGIYTRKTISIHLHLLHTFPLIHFPSHPSFYATSTRTEQRTRQRQERHQP
jgi:hypothetical protein